MGSISDKLLYLAQTKTEIKNALTAKGVPVTDVDTLRSYADKIGSISDVVNPLTPIYETINGSLYRLILNEDFNDATIDKNIWSDRYLASWTDKPYLADADYSIQDSILTLKISEDSNPWSPNDGDLRVSGIQTGERIGLHKQTPVHHTYKKFMGHISRYGYFELKAKTFPGSGTHCAWWMIGLEDMPNQVYEIDIFEALGGTPTIIDNVTHQTASNEPGFAKIFYNTGVNLTQDYHIYGFEWTPTEFIFFFDGVEYRRVSCALAYPLITILSCYESRAGNWTGAFNASIPYPKEFKIDYIKFYKKALAQETALAIVSQTPINITPAVYTVNNIEGDISVLPSYVILNWNDGTSSEHWVEWDAITDIKKNKIISGPTFVWQGNIHGVPQELLNGLRASATIQPITIGTTILFDDFNRADSSTTGTATTGQQWLGLTDASGAVSQMAISSNKAKVVGTTNCMVRADCGYSDVSIEADVTHTGLSNWVSIYARGNNTTNMLLTDEYGFGYGNGKLLINKVVERVGTDLVTKAFTPVSGQTYKMKFVVKGNSLKGYIDDVLQLETTDSTYPTGTRVGMKTWDNANVLYENFTVKIV